MVYAVILSGGEGKRIGSEHPKQFLPLGGKPVLLWSVDLFNSIKQIDHIIVVSNPRYMDETRAYVKGFDKILKIISGGETRQDSVYNALASHEFSEKDIILFHDAARPFITKNIIMRCLAAIENSDAAGTYLPATDTITEIETGYVNSIPDRKKIFYTQTPQIFKYAVIKNSHEHARAQGIHHATDDVYLVLNSGYRVKTVEGDYLNIKITTQFDYEFAQWIAEKNKAAG